MMKKYMFKALAAMVCFVGMTSEVKAFEAADLVGRYALVSNDSENGGSMGLPVNFDVTVREDGNGGLIMSGFFGKGNTINALFDKETNVITINPGNYVDMGVSLEEGAMSAMHFLLVVEDGTPNMMKPIEMKVEEDGTITFENHIGDAVGFFTMTVVEALKGGKMTKKEVAQLTPEKIAGTYTFKNEKEINEAYEELLEGFDATDDDQLVIKSQGDNKYTVSGLFGTDIEVPAVYYPEIGQLIVETNRNLGGADFGESSEGSYILGTMLTDSYFDVEDGKISTNNTIFVSFEADDDSDYDDAVLVLFRGGEGTRNATSVANVKAAVEGSVDVYTTNGVLVQKAADLDNLNLPKGVYILKGENGAKKVLF